MKITKIEAVYPSYEETLKDWRPNLWQIITKIYTDNNKIYGFGTGGGGKASIEIIRGHLAALVVGKEVENINDIKSIYDNLYKETIPYGRGGVGSMAISSIDLALWDTFSKYYEIPIKNLLEKNKTLHNESINTYATGNNINTYNQLGIENFKLSVKSNGDFENEKKELYDSIYNIKKKYNNSKKIMIDCYMSWDIEYTKKMSRFLSDLKIYWIEDISSPETLLNSESILGKLDGAFLAGGEHDLNHNNFSIMKKNNTYDFWQPDITWCGGISSLLKIIDISDKEYPIILHRGGEPWGLPLIQSGLINNLAEIHNPKDKKISMSKWENKTINKLDKGILYTNEYLGFGANPIKGIFND
ncbi:MAG: enolase C-terminal domain-like protein [Dehalococcoidia bacterium]|nr:enolase C-terminal domain-like protein [Dehalococcoidia bacterium]